ncbi:ABC transporter permease [Luteolibacter arcticus]|uniref:ABC transporter permease n=1 Tax=Luteolibacter arcticus TaxID=1581411 RepID=A0ABT3GGB5_9BACT|nr:ABC transporter permease [Luteolibacter arcticus]MCW1922651.1 ABC transporter permease [Luteolibacter arcticus]
MTDPVPASDFTEPRRVRSASITFWSASAGMLAFYAILLGGILLATGAWASPETFSRALASREIRHSIMMSVVSCGLATLLSLWVAVPAAYVLSRCRFRGKTVLEILLDLPIVMPPLVLGLGLLLLFQTVPGRWIEGTLGWRFTYTTAGVVLAQFTVACAFAIRSLRATFDEMPRRPEQVARTLGASDSQVFCRVVIPAARRGLLHAAAVAWARGLGEFGPILVFAGATRMKTEVLPTTVFLELSIGNLETAAAVSMLLLLAAAAVLVLLRWLDARDGHLH